MRTLEIIAAAIALAIVVASVVRRVVAFAARARAGRVTTDLTCPKRGTRVRCTMLVDEAKGRYVGVGDCSVFGAGVRPGCSETCAWLMNDGIPLARVTSEESPADDGRVHLPLLGTGPSSR